MFEQSGSSFGVAFLVEQGITSISVTPDAVVRARLAVMKAEADLGVAPGQQDADRRMTA